MKSLHKKLAIGLLSGAFVLAGSTAIITLVSAAVPQQQTMELEKPQPPRRPSLNQRAQQLEKSYGVNASEVVAYCNDGGRFRDACRIALACKLSGKSFGDIAAAKTPANTWKDVYAQNGITREQVKEFKQNQRAECLSQRGNIDKATALQLLQNGYRVKDIHKAAILSKAAGKDVQLVLDMKKINNRWVDVANQLGVDKELLKVEGRPGHKAPGRGHGMKHHGMGHGHGMMAPAAQ